MKKTSWPLGLTLAATLLALPMASVGDDEQTLRHFKTVLWPQAYRNQDTKLLSRLLHDSFELIDNSGGRSDKQGELDYIANNQWNPGSFEYQIERLQIYQGAFAVIAGRGVASRYTYRSSNFLVKENGRWQAIASHVSGYEAIPTRKAVFIIIDGIPADVLESAETPFIDDIARRGGYTRAFVGGMVGWRSESPTVSAVGYNSLLTGTWANKHNVWTNRIEKPNYAYWDIFRAAKNHNHELRTAVFSTWTDNRTKLLGDGLPAAGGKKLDYHYDGFDYDTERFPHDLEDQYIADIDALVAKEAARYIEAEAPDLSWVYLQHSDDIGHRYGDSKQMEEAVRVMDRQVGQIWNAVQRRESEQAESWLVFVTTDHGRDALTGKNHGRQSVRERTIWIATNATTLNKHFHDRPAIVDLFPSIATHLQLELPTQIKANLDGRSLISE